MECLLPEGCHFEYIFGIQYDQPNNKRIGESAIMCDIDSDGFEFKFDVPINGSNECDEYTTIDQYIIFRWTSSTILDSHLNLTNVNRYFNIFIDLGSIRLMNLKSVDVNIFDDSFYSIDTKIHNIDLTNCRLDFYHDKKKLNSCQDFIDLNITEIRSVFQIASEIIILRDVDYNGHMCPRVFMNTNIETMVIKYLVDTFYKKNILSFENETDLNISATIEKLYLGQIENINLDLNLLHPSVFRNLSQITIHNGWLNSIDGNIFKHFVDNSLKKILMEPLIFRKINHKQGIAWLRQMASYQNLSANFSLIEIVLVREYFKPNYRLSNIFPEEDFCIYVDLPPRNRIDIQFEIYIIEWMNEYQSSKRFPCTYLWLAPNYVGILLNSTSTETEIKSKCNFEQRVNLCNKSNYQLKDIWDQNDFYILIMKLQIGYKILLYPISFLCLFTNLIVVIVIIKKENKDLFKGFKQYTYLYLNSIFCVMISVIEILSWMTECFYPFGVFCPETRKLIAIQFFKIIFKECLVTMFRFMCNFTYVAFALNRISLIGKDHGKIVTFMSQVGIKKYIGISFLISCSFSWIKGFKYDVNYIYPYLNFPIPNDQYMFEDYSPNAFLIFYFTFNSICDLFNYLVFVLICIIIDIGMVVQLRRVLEEKSKKSESLQKNESKKQAENEEAINKAIKMVVFNSLIGICFKIPTTSIPLINMCAVIYYRRFKEDLKSFSHFAQFFIYLNESRAYSLIQDVSYLLYTLSLAIQMFIYKRFDRKFQTGYERLKEKAFSYIKDRFKSDSIAQQAKK